MCKSTATRLLLFVHCNRGFICTFQAFAASDPDALAALQARAVVCKAAADRWTDNVWTLKSYLVNSMGKAPVEVDSLLGIDDSFDYVK
jgi:hypothetical protein